LGFVRFWRYWSPRANGPTTPRLTLISLLMPIRAPCCRRPIRRDRHPLADQNHDALRLLEPLEPASSSSDRAFKVAAEQLIATNAVQPLKHPHSAATKHSRRGHQGHVCAVGDYASAPPPRWWRSDRPQRTTSPGLMTRMAAGAGMKRLWGGGGGAYKTPSVLPHDGPRHTARDQAVSRARHPRARPALLPIFSILSFTFRGQSISNHNASAREGRRRRRIKTEYRRRADSIGDLRSPRRAVILVAVVMVGSSGASRDARMLELITERSRWHRSTHGADGPPSRAPGHQFDAAVRRRPRPSPSHVVTRASAGPSHGRGQIPGQACKQINVK